MFTSTSRADLAQSAAADVLIPVIRAAATIGFAIAPCSLGFVIIAVSEQLIRSIMVGDDPEMLMSDLQNQFPNHAIELNEDDGVGLVAKVVELIDRPDKAALPSALSRDIKPDTIGPRGCKIEWLEAYRLMDAHRSAARRCNGGIRDPIGERCAGGQVDLNRAHSNPGAAAAGCAER